MPLHKSLGVGDIHIAHNWSYATQVARLAATGFVPTDVGRIALQEEDWTLWLLISDDPPDWVQVGGTAGEVTETSHKILRQLIHFIDYGPADGFASGAYREITGTTFPTAIIWYDSSGPGKKKIVEKLITYAGVLPATIAWKVYDAGEILLAMVTDTVTYSGVFETSRVRVIA